MATLISLCPYFSIWYNVQHLTDNRNLALCAVRNIPLIRAAEVLYLIKVKNLVVWTNPCVKHILWGVKTFICKYMEQEIQLSLFISQCVCSFTLSLRLIIILSMWWQIFLTLNLLSAYCIVEIPCIMASTYCNQSICLIQWKPKGT